MKTVNEELIPEKVGWAFPPYGAPDLGTLHIYIIPKNAFG